MNLDGRPAPHLGHVFGWKFGLGPREEAPVSDPRAAQPAPRVAPDMDRVRNPDPARVQLTYIGHATWLIQAGGLNFITDPVFSNDCSPFPVPRIPRHVPPGIALPELPRIDVVILSHSHYDHLDVASLRALKGARECVAPLGLGSIAGPCLGIRVEEAEWGECLESTGPGTAFSLTCLPTQHASARSAWDRDTTLWCGWLIELAGRRIHFVGDTAWADFFPELGRWLGGVDLALIPIGAYRPRWFMKSVHCNPEEAVQVHRSIGAKRSLAMHWGVFELADEPLGEPPLLLASAADEANLTPGEFSVPAVGETVVL